MHATAGVGLEWPLVGETPIETSTRRFAVVT
jgi:hypothetical protein